MFLIVAQGGLKTTLKAKSKIVLIEMYKEKNS